MLRRPAIDHVRRVIRSRVCANCPSRTAGNGGTSPASARPCEAHCPLFVHLPLLFEIGRHADPIVGHRLARLRAIARKIAPPAGPTRRNAYAAVDAIEEALGD